MLKAYKYRIYPDGDQKVLLAKHFGCCRWLYNYALSKKKSAYEKDKTNLSRFDLQAELPLLKKAEETQWLSEVNAQSLQATLLHLDKAYKTFFRNKKGFPQFKKKRNRQSFSVPANKREINWEEGFLSIPKINNIPIILSRKFTGSIKTITISKSPTNRYFASILIENEESLPVKPEIKESTTIGIDMGLKDFITMNDGEKIANPKFLNRDLSRIKVLQRRMRNKTKGSNNKKKQILKISKLHERVANRRLDFLHKLTHRLTHDNQVNTICMEDLRIQNMLKNHNLAQAISDVSWSKFAEMLGYKCEWYGKNFIQIGTFEPSTKTCNACKHKQTIKLSQREWQCENCHATHDRDVNAAKNIKFMGLQGISGAARSGVPVEPPALVGALKQEMSIGDCT